MANAGASTPGAKHIDNWEAINWKQIQTHVFRLQRRIYRAAQAKNWTVVRSLQKLSLGSWSARCLAVRQVTQDNRGKKTPGVDGVASIPPEQRLDLVEGLREVTRKADPLRRVYIPKPGKDEQRPLSIPTMRDRAMQALVKLALEPEWEAKFEPNSYGFRPGRSAHDAISAIFTNIAQRAKYVLDADIEKCFDRIDHAYLLGKLKTIRSIERLVRGWLKAGIIDQGQTLFPKAGTPQGGVASPLLANVALHGLEQHLGSLYERVRVIRYADDLVVLHEDRATIEQIKTRVEAWLAPVGLRLKPSKTRISHTLEAGPDRAGFDFLGFEVQQRRVSDHRSGKDSRGRRLGHKTVIQPSREAQRRHLQRLREIIRRHRGAHPEALVKALNPIIQGWTGYYGRVASKRTFGRVDYQLWRKLQRWGRFRHPPLTKTAISRRYWTDNRFGSGAYRLGHHVDRKIVRHVKVRGVKSPFDGDWVYWTGRMGRYAGLPRWKAKLVKQQAGRCPSCGLYLQTGQVLEVHHRDRDRRNNRYANLALVHGHCHDVMHRRQRSKV